MQTIWVDVKLPEFPRLEEDLSTQVLIVGGGIAGLMCAWKLTKAGVDCVLIEEGRIMGGVSGRTTAKITAQHGLIYKKLMREFGTERARMYWQANTEAVSAYRKLAESMDFELQTQCSSIFAKDSLRELEDEWEAYDKLGIPARWEKTLPLPFPVAGALCLDGQAQMHPLKLAAGIAEKLKIYEHTKVVSIAGHCVKTPCGTVTAEKIVIATHFPILNQHGLYFMKLYQQRSYVLALENADEVDGMYLDAAENGLSVRGAGKYLLLGGGGHRTGKQGKNWTLAEETAAHYYSNARTAAKWAAQDCMTLDGMPYIGHYSRNLPHVYVATGFGKWGMTNSMIAADLLTDLILEKQNPYASLFSPSRSILHMQLAINAAEYAANFIRLRGPRCPHLGCVLKWNSAERSWDCPCHGSRFDPEGKCLNNPATDDLRDPPQPK